MSKLPPRGTHIEDLKCKKCGKKLKDTTPQECPEPECPHKPVEQSEE